MMMLNKLRCNSRTLLLILGLASVALVQGCFHSKSSSTPTYSIGGTVSGLSGTLVLQNNSGDDLTVTADGSFVFETVIAQGGDYSVSVLSQPGSQACAVTNLSGSATATVDDVIVECADPVGYYSGGDLNVDGADDNGAAQGFVRNNQLFLMSVSIGLLYVGDITITGESFTTTATIYQDGANAGTTEISGAITPGSKITGDLTNQAGSGVGSGTFTVFYAASNNDADTADITKVDRYLSERWDWTVAGGQLFNIQIMDEDNVGSDTAGDDGTFKDCMISVGTIKPISNTDLYTMTVTLVECFTNTNANNQYTGLATTTDSDGTIVIMLINGDFAVYGDGAAM